LIFSSSELPHSSLSLSQFLSLSLSLATNLRKSVIIEITRRFYRRRRRSPYERKKTYIRRVYVIIDSVSLFLTKTMRNVCDDDDRYFCPLFFDRPFFSANVFVFTTMQLSSFVISFSLSLSLSLSSFRVHKNFFPPPFFSVPDVESERV